MARRLAMELDESDIHIAALQEVRWPGTGTSAVRTLPDRPPTHKMLREDLVGAVIVEEQERQDRGAPPDGDRLSTLYLRARPHNLYLINAHVPTEDKSAEEKDAFYTLLREALRTAPRDSVPLLLGDYNAQIGRYAALEDVTGLHSLHQESNDNGRRLTDFAVNHNLVVASTRQERTDIHKITWFSNDQVTRNQIDHVLVPRRSSALVNNVTSLPKAHFSTDHQLLLTVISAKADAELFRLTRKLLKKPFQGAAGLIRDEEGSLLTEQDQILDRWRRHLNDLLNVPGPEDPIMPPLEEEQNSTPMAPPTLSEIKHAIDTLKKKSAG
ncbi:hypothetical protein FOCC_FOCC015458, partial [Frankliniella occidentalis]